MVGLLPAIIEKIFTRIVEPDDFSAVAAGREGGKVQLFSAAKCNDCHGCREPASAVATLSKDSQHRAAATQRSPHNLKVSRFEGASRGRAPNDTSVPATRRSAGGGDLDSRYSG